MRVRLEGVIVAESDAALVLTEAAYPPVYYVSRADARWAHFARSERTTHCPYKGEACYFDLSVGETIRAGAVWSYEDPHPAVIAIRDHLAFYPDRVDAIEIVET